MGFAGPTHPTQCFRDISAPTTIHGVKHIWFSIVFDPQDNLSEWWPISSCKTENDHLDIAHRRQVA